MKSPLVFAFLLVSTSASAAVLYSQPPVAGGGVMRSSQLWIDPINDNDSDADAKCWADFTLPVASTIDHMEWWGAGASELGFIIEFWPQDPGTIAYQPLAVFDQVGPPTVTPTKRLVVAPGQYTTAAEGSLTHFSLDLGEAVSLAANDSANPRWFVGVIARTPQFSAPWSWAQGTGANHTYWWRRGDANHFTPLGDGRALVLSGVPEAGAFGAAVVLALVALSRRRGDVSAD